MAPKSLDSSLLFVWPLRISVMRFTGTPIRRVHPERVESPQDLRLRPPRIGRSHASIPPHPAGPGCHPALNRPAYSSDRQGVRHPIGQPVIRGAPSSSPSTPTTPPIPPSSPTSTSSARCSGSSPGREAPDGLPARGAVRGDGPHAIPGRCAQAVWRKRSTTTPKTRPAGSSHQRPRVLTAPAAIRCRPRPLRPTACRCPGSPCRRRRPRNGCRPRSR